MATSSNKKKKTATSAKNWKRNKGEDLELPSGNVALVKRPGPAALLNKGVLPDTLMPIVQSAIRSGQGLKPQDEKDLMKDPQAIADMLDAIDRLLVEVVMEPKAVYHKHLIKSGEGVAVATSGPAHEEWVNIPEEYRTGDEENPCPQCGVVHPDAEEIIYSDEVDLEDKLFIFQYAVGGTRDLERFRGEFGTGLGDLLAGARDANATVGSGGDSEEGQAH